MRYGKTVRPWICVCLLLALCAAFLTGCASSGASAKGGKKLSAKDRGMELIAVMAELADNRAQGQAAELAAMLETVGEGDYRKAEHIYRLKLDEEALLDVAEDDGYDPDELSAEAYAALIDALYESVWSRAAGPYGTMVLAAASMTRTSKRFIDTGLDGNMIYFYTFQEGYPALIAFLVGEGGAVEARGCFLPTPDFGRSELRQALRGDGIKYDIEEVE